MLRILIEILAYFCWIDLTPAPETGSEINHFFLSNNNICLAFF